MSARPEPPLSDCGCCEPAVPPTPGSIENPPAAPALAYRVGTHPHFLAAMQRGAASQAPLRRLRTREVDDPAVALMDAWAATLDVLTFYTERTANEGYLRTATELGSLVELARTVGYERAQGRASETTLAFTLDTSPGSPTAVPIPAGTKVASLPGPGETPQTFETTDDVLARPAWNAVTARTGAPAPPVVGTTRLFLAGAATGLRPGDHLLIVGRDDSASSERWILRAVRHISLVARGPGDEITEVSWDEPLGQGRGGTELVPVTTDVRVFALRIRTSLFGAMAPDWRAIPAVVQAQFLAVSTSSATSVAMKALPTVAATATSVVSPPGPDDWPRFTVVPSGAAANTVDLDGDHPAVGVGSWVVLQRGTTTELYRVQTATAMTRSDFAISGKVTRLVLSGGPSVATTFSGGLRTTVALARSEQLELAEAPVTEPVQGRRIELAAPLAEPLAAGRLVVVSGPAPEVEVAEGVHTLQLVEASGATGPLHPGDRLVVTAPTSATSGGAARTWPVRRTSDDASGTVVAGPGQLLVVQPAAPGTDSVELATVAEPTQGTDPTEVLELVADLAGIYDRVSLRVAANVAPASHGETRTEILGNGEAAASFQRFRLAQAPLTYRVGSSGLYSTLEIRVDGVRWDEVPSLALAGAGDRVYVVRTDEEDRATVIFGDGRHGARLPTGQENVAATYRVGIGLAGRLDAHRLTMALTRPLGVRSVTNPLPTGVAAEPDPPASLRRNAPQTALTFDRVVSLTDFEDFARATPGVGKAKATWRWQGEARPVYVTVAGEAGQALGEQASNDLAAALRAAGDPRQPLVVEEAAPVTFDVVATVVSDPRLVAGTVKAAGTSALLSTFGFDARELGQPVTASEVVAALHRVPGVVAVNLTSLRLSEAADPAVETFLLAAPTQLLTVRPAGIALTEEPG